MIVTNKQIKGAYDSLKEYKSFFKKEIQNKKERDSTPRSDFVRATVEQGHTRQVQTVRRQRNRYNNSLSATA